jgi:2-polyprenyl-6-methoxyphenol hydroxylase-like FAD-dependent oxidoreductase
MSGQDFDVAIVGGGIGGLCLAQGLKKAGIPVTIYERDATPGSRLQGYRIHIDPEGSSALHQCLPDNLWRIFEATQGEFAQGITIVSEQLAELLRVRPGDLQTDLIARHRSISRITLRHILLAGLDDRVRFGKRLERYEEMADSRYALYFADGSRAEADLLIGADGVNSMVRRQYLPAAEPVDTGVIALSGKVPLTDGVMALAPARLLDGPIMVASSQPCSLFMAIWKRQPAAAEPLRTLGIEQVPQGDADYLILGFGARPDYFGFPGDPENASGRTMINAMCRVTASWHPTLRKLTEMVDESSLNVNRLRTSRPVQAWRTSRITLLGDSIHSMTPYRGVGANIALKDAALLCAKLGEAHRGEKSLLDAIAEYEAFMREYAFAAVEASRKTMEQAVSENKHFALAKVAMRVMNTVPFLRRRLVAA